MTERTEYKAVPNRGNPRTVWTASREFVQGEADLFAELYQTSVLIVNRSLDVVGKVDAPHLNWNPPAYGRAV